MVDSSVSPVQAGNPKPAQTAASFETLGEGRTSRLTLWLIWAGFGLMFVAALLMWTSFGPTMFVDLATAVVNCF